VAQLYAVIVFSFRLIDHLLSIVRNIDFSRDSFSRNEEKVARDYWELSAK
jgi:hypothetical protein